MKTFTTDHEQVSGVGRGKGVRGKSLFSGKRGGFYKEGSVLLGAAYVGYNYNGKAYRIGGDIPTGQDVIQNGVHEVLNLIKNGRYYPLWTPENKSRLYFNKSTEDSYSLY